MSAQPPHHAAPRPRSGPQVPRTARFWLVPIVVSLAAMAALATFYLAGILNPMTNLRHFPIAVVNEDTGPTGAQITNELVTGVDSNQFDIRVLSPGDARHQLDTAQVYGQVLIPPHFTDQLNALKQSAVQPGHATRPVITVSTNPRAGSLGSNIASQTMTRALAGVNTKLGQQLSTQATQQNKGAPLPGGAALVLANPLDVQTDAHNPLPNGTGNGLSAFYYSLVLLLAGFTGSTVISALVDSQLGYAPAEIGPVYRIADQVQISRFRTLLTKWGLMLVLAVLTSSVYLGIATALGMPITHTWGLWLYGIFAITAVGVTCTSIAAALGSMGLLVNLLIYVILGLPSAGATIPLEATPSAVAWLAHFEPMHQVFLGTRSLVYFDAHGDAGLAHALIMCAVGLAVGLTLGIITTTRYDRNGFRRISTATSPPAPAGIADGTVHSASPGGSSPWVASGRLIAADGSAISVHVDAVRIPHDAAVAAPSTSALRPPPAAWHLHPESTGSL